MLNNGTRPGGAQGGGTELQTADPCGWEAG